MVYNWLNIEHHCSLCDERCETGQSVCGACEAELPWLREHCTLCALPLPASGLICGECLKRPPAFDRVIVPWRFAFPVDTLISRFKHQAQWPLGRLLAEHLSQHLQHAFDEGLPRPDALLPVPLARKRYRQRGFNQAQMLTDWLSAALAIPLTDDQKLAGRHLAIIDDVLPTGATAEALARLLKRAGAVRVDVYCLARTPKPGD